MALLVDDDRMADDPALALFQGQTGSGQVSADSLSRYVSAGLITFLAKAVAALGTLAEIYFLNLLLGKEEYGQFVYAFTIMMLVGIIFGNPLRTLVLYKLSAHKTDILQSDFFRSSFALSICLGFVAFISVLSFGWTVWVVGLAALAAFEMIRVTLCTGLQATQNIAAMTFYNTLLPYGLRLTGLIILSLIGLSEPTYIIAAYIIAFAVPVAVMAVRYKILPHFSLKPFIKSDYTYGLKMILTQLVHQNARYIDILFIGSLGMMAATAEYNVALKFATLLLIGKQLTQGLITPRLTGMDGRNEFAAARTFETAIAFLGIIGFAIVGPFILPHFGDYGSVKTLFFLCAAAMVPRVVTGSSAEFLSMKGHAGWVFAASLIALILTIVTAIVLVPVYGAQGSAITALVGAFSANVILGVGAYKTENFIVTPVFDGIMGMAALFICLMVGFDAINILTGGVILSLIFFGYLFYHRQYIYDLKNFIRR